VRTPGSEPDAGRTSELIRAARAGSPEALGQLLEACRAYLLLVANEDLDRDLRAKGGASDLVQQTFLEAQQGFGGFAGHNQRELLNWLRGILRHNLQDFRRRYRGRAARQVGREEPLGDGEEAEMHTKLMADMRPPEDGAISAEQAEELTRALGRLSADHRRVLALRHEEALSFPEIGRRMGRTAEAARKLWFRAVERLRLEMGTPHEPGP
jgi:RNA polymerase sigma-70 factor (ECF subfamily)